MSDTTLKTMIEAQISAKNVLNEGWRIYSQTAMPEDMNPWPREVAYHSFMAGCMHLHDSLFACPEIFSEVAKAVNAELNKFCDVVAAEAAAIQRKQES